MTTKVTPQQLTDARWYFEQQISVIPDLQEHEQKESVDLCVAYFANHEGEKPTAAGIVGIARHVRSQRAARQVELDRIVKGMGL
jgi:hypothetical protein